MIKHVLICVSLVVALSAIGCGGASIQDRAEQGFSAAFLKVADNAKIDQSTLSARGNIHNPSYRCKGFGGTGFYFDGTFEVIGVELDASATGSGTGTAPLDLDLRNRLDAILSRQDMADAERLAMIERLLTKVLTSQPSE